MSDNQESSIENNPIKAVRRGGRGDGATRAPTMAEKLRKNREVLEGCNKGQLQFLASGLPDSHAYRYFNQKEWDEGKRKGWIPVRASDHPQLYSHIDSASKDDLVRIADLTLMQIEKEIWEDTCEYWNEKGIEKTSKQTIKNFRSVGEGLQGPQIPYEDPKTTNKQRRSFTREDFR